VTDCGSNLLYRAVMAEFPALVEEMDKDLYGKPRLANGAIDIGAIEYDWCKRYAADLRATTSSFSVTNASPTVVESEVGGVELSGGDEVHVVWGNRTRSEATYTICAEVTGAGTLTVLLNGETLATLDEAGGSAKWQFGNSFETNALVFKFAGEGKARLFGFSRNIGTVVIIR